MSLRSRKLMNSIFIYCISQSTTLLPACNAAVAVTDEDPYNRLMENDVTGNDTNLRVSTAISVLGLHVVFGRFQRL